MIDSTSEIPSVKSYCGPTPSENQGTPLSSITRPAIARVTINDENEIMLLDFLIY